MHKFDNRRLPSVFDTFFIQVNKKHNHNTRSASNLSYTLPKVRTSYGIFNTRFKGPGQRIELNEGKFENLINLRLQGVSKMRSSQRLLATYVLISSSIDFQLTCKLVFC